MTLEDTPVVIDLGGNDNFEDPAHVITLIDSTAATVGAPIAVSNGTVLLNADGTLTFTPTPNFNGPTTFTYTVSAGGVTETAMVTVDVTPVADPPVFTTPPGGKATRSPTRWAAVRPMAR
ncbi:MAG: cadherin-like domain-containing protein [Proteobacteria bacterium]|nr:cadherin-like domain-containing protein [Pseudomonadota bacterium]